jgi:hypothetical protein
MSYTWMAVFVLVLLALIVFLQVTTTRGRRRAGGAKCAVCKCPMMIISGGIIDRDLFAKVQGCFRCQACGRFTCYDHSDNRSVCSCGRQAWQQLQYLPEQEVSRLPKGSMRKMPPYMR